MPDDVGGLPFPDGEGPESRDRGAADEAFAAVVLDEEFISAARFHEPSAAERLLLAGLERADAETEPGAPGTPPGAGYGGFGPVGGTDPAALDELRGARVSPGHPDLGRRPANGPSWDAPDEGSSAAPPRAPRIPGRPPARWQRPVACVLAMVMGISMIAIALVSVQRAASVPRADPPVPVPPVSDRGGPGGGKPTGETSRGEGTAPLP